MHHIHSQLKSLCQRQPMSILSKVVVAQNQLRNTNLYTNGSFSTVFLISRAVSFTDQI